MNNNIELFLLENWVIYLYYFTDAIFLGYDQSYVQLYLQSGSSF